MNNWSDRHRRANSRSTWPASFWPWPGCRGWAPCRPSRACRKSRRDGSAAPGDGLGYPPSVDIITKLPLFWTHKDVSHVAIFREDSGAKLTSSMLVSPPNVFNMSSTLSTIPGYSIRSNFRLVSWKYFRFFFFFHSSGFTYFLLLLHCTKGILVSLSTTPQLT